MHLILFNFRWMTFNVFLALIPVAAGWLFLNTRQRELKIVYAIIWLLFLPNTLYLYTDIINVYGQWGRVGSSEKIIIVLQYVILEIIGFVTFVLSLYPFQKFLTTLLKKKNIDLINIFIILLNFLVGFGIVLGRIERVNSWEVLTNIGNVIQSSANIVNSPRSLLLFILFGLISNFSYFLLRRPVVRFFSTYLSRVDA